MTLLPIPTAVHAKLAMVALDQFVGSQHELGRISLPIVRLLRLGSVCIEARIYAYLRRRCTESALEFSIEVRKVAES